MASWEAQKEQKGNGRKAGWITYPSSWSRGILGHFEERTGLFLLEWWNSPLGRGQDRRVARPKVREMDSYLGLIAYMGPVENYFTVFFCGSTSRKIANVSCW